MLRTIAGLALSLAVLALPAAVSAQDRAEGEEQQHNRLDVQPYIEAAQVLVAELSPGDDMVTYTSIAAGVDASIRGRNNAAALSLRYERRIGWGDDAPDGDVISGIARASAAVIPHALTIEAGGLAARSRIEGNGAAIQNPIIDNGGESNIYSVYAGPSLRTDAGDVSIEGQYRIGYSRIEEPDALVTAPGADPVDVFDDSVVQMAQLRVGSRPNQLLPVGVGVGAGWYQEDISNLDQRVANRWVRGDVTVPVSPNVALVGGVGYEDVEVSARDALRDELGNPVIGSDGRYRTDPDAPRKLAYDVEGLIWDVGVIWRPSRRTELEAHIGRRYGSTTYYGTLSYKPNSRSSLNVSVYDNIAGFGGQVNNMLAGLPTDFEVNRNPISGDLSTCVVSLEGGNCLGGVLGAVRSSTFRARGVTASYAMNFGRWRAGVGIGYDRRKYIAAEGTVLASANGLVDENVWLAAYLSGRLDERSTLSTNVYATWFNSSFDFGGSTRGYGASAAYNRLLTAKLAATAAVSLDGLTRDEDLEDIWSAAALLGLRYSF